MRHPKQVPYGQPPSKLGISGPVIMIIIESARSTATPAKERGQPFAPTYVPSVAFTSSTCTCMLPRMKPWSMRNGLQPI